METNFNLKESPVVFDHEHHTYKLNGHELSGVTPIIAWLFPDTYKGIPQSVLDQAADYGTTIHEKCELYDSMGILSEMDGTSIIHDYIKMMADANLHVAMSEYLVSDERYVASKIDKVFMDGSIGDIKTTSKVHMVNVQVQLSIYAYLYELQNKGKKVNKLWLIWLPKEQYGMPELREVPRIPAEVCAHVVELYNESQGLLSAALNAIAALSPYLAYEPERKRVEGEVPEAYTSVIDELIMVKKQLDVLSEREKDLRTMLLAGMQGVNEDKWSNDLIQISRRAASERESVDAKALKMKMPEVYESFKKVTKVAESLTYKVL